MRPPWLQWRNVLVWFGACVLLEVLIAGLTVVRARSGSEPAYGSYLLDHVHVGVILLFAIGLCLYALSYVPFPFPLPSRFSPRNFRAGAFVGLVFAAGYGCEAFLDIWQGPSHYRGNVVVGVELISGPTSNEMIFTVAGKDFSTKDVKQYPLVQQGKCLRVTYAKHTDLVTSLFPC